jgi:Fe-S cluster assembly protein SufD
MKITTINPAWNKELLTKQQVHSIIHDIAELNSWQRNALSGFLQQGFPDRKHEDWKYTNVNEIANRSFAMPEPRVRDIPPLEEIADSYRVIFVNGHFRRDLSEFPSEVILADTATMLKEKQWQAYLQFDQRYATVFSNLNAALMTNGIFIYVPPKIVLTKPIHFVYYHSEPNQSMQHPCHLIIAGRESQLTLVEEYVGENAYFNNVVTFVHAEEGSVVQHYKLQMESDAAQHIANTIVRQEKNSSVTSFVVSLGARLNRENLNFALNQEGASCHLYGLYLPFGNQHVDHHTRVDHSVPNCFSQQIYKGIIGGKGHAVFNGKVIVHPNAQKTAAYQSNKNILLSLTAEIDTKPELEIYADDVKCAHGATVGQLDANALFYLQSRGIEKKLAQNILTKAFAEEILTNVQTSTIAKYIHRKVEARLLEVQ